MRFQGYMEEKVSEDTFNAYSTILSWCESQKFFLNKHCHFSKSALYDWQDFVCKFTLCIIHTGMILQAYNIYLLLRARRAFIVSCHFRSDTLLALNRLKYTKYIGLHGRQTINLNYQLQEALTTAIYHKDNDLHKRMMNRYILQKRRCKFHCILTTIFFLLIFFCFVSSAK